MPQKEITNNELAKLIAGLQADLNEKFKKIDSRLDRHDDYFTAIKTDLNQLDYNLQAVSQSQTRIEEGMKIIKQDYDAIKLRQEQMVYRFEIDNLVKRVQKLEEKTKTKTK
jgi:polyhydroxyalkanoate synthesis regulator phasin